MACYQAKYDVLITNDFLPDGSSKDLTQVLGSTIACLTMDNQPVAKAFADPLIHSDQTDRLPSHQPKDWITILKRVIQKWENRMNLKIVQNQEDQRFLHDKVAALCVAELYRYTENRIDNVLRIILHALNVSRVYIRDESINYLTPNYLHVVSATEPRLTSSEEFSSVYEVPMQNQNGQIAYLGIVDNMYKRTWNKSETDLLATLATLLRDNRRGVRHLVNMHSRLEMIA